MHQSFALRVGLLFWFSCVLVFARGDTLIAQEGPRAVSPIVSGERWTMHSSVLNEDRIISVHLPSDYAQTATKYPVLYALDGEQDFDEVVGVAEALPWARRGPDMIVVAIHNTHRAHDFTTAWSAGISPGQSQWMVARAGGADNFLAFLKNELLPEVDRRYRTAPFRILLGHSLGGLFALHALVTAPELFNATIALSAPAFWNGDEPINRAVELFSKRPDLRGFLFVDRAATEFDDTPRAVQKLGEALRLRAPETLRWQTQVIAGEDHGTAFVPGVQAGLEFVFTDWRLPSLVFDEGLDSVERYYKKLSAVYGFEVAIPEGEISALAARTREPKVAIRIWERYTQLYPESTTAFAGFAQSLDESGDLVAAKQAYAKAVILAAQSNDPREADLKQRENLVLTRLKSRP